MPLSILVALAVISLIGLTVAVVSTARAESRRGAGPAVSLTYRAYGACPPTRRARPAAGQR